MKRSYFIFLYLMTTITTVVVFASSTAPESFDALSTECSVQIEKNNATVIVKKDPLFPSDPFTLKQKRYGLVLIHIFGVVYTFFALAIVCDEFFVPALEVIIEILNLTPDVAGATFMAAGGSAPELFTSIMGVFISFDDVGIGTIVGSAVFNILFVIGACAIFSRTVLNLTWWPLFRDCSFYSIGLVTLILFFQDSFIELHEAFVLLMVYVLYSIFMKWNHSVEMFIKKTVLRKNITRVGSADHLMQKQEIKGTDTAACRKDSNTSIKFRRGLLQLMMQTLDPMHDEKVDEKAIELHALASLKALLDSTKPNQGGSSSTAAKNLRSLATSSSSLHKTADHTFATTNPLVTNQKENEEENKPLDLSWPDTTRNRLFYIFTLPIILPLWLTLPNPRNERGRKFFVVTFIGSIFWIAIYSYLMVWWANIVGETLYVPSEVMGLTFLAAGTSVPDLVTSVIVARKGCGDMAVSSSVGSNIFDITVGLPFPWILYNLIVGCPVKVNSVGIMCSIFTLFLMLLFVIVSIAFYGWKMTHSLGYTMFFLYVLFVSFSLMFEYHIIKCPV